MKKLLSLVLLLLILCVSSVTVSAAETVCSGNAGREGDNVTWTVDSDGVLTISGTGEMKDFGWSKLTPWASALGGRGKVEKVIFEEGVTSIGTNAFYDEVNLEAVEFSGSIQEIHSHAFENCGLEKVELPSSLEKLADFTFLNCNKLKTIIFLNHNTIVEGDPFFWNEDVRLYALKAGTVAAFAEDMGYQFEVVSQMQVKNCYLDGNLGTTSATLTWDAVPLCDGYYIYRYNSASKKYELEKSLGIDKNSCKITGLKGGTVYQYKVGFFLELDGKSYTGDGEPVRFRTRSSSASVTAKNDKIADGYAAALKTATYKYSGLKNLAATDYYHYAANVSDFCQFKDNKGNFCVAYVNSANTYMFIRAYNTDMKQVYYRKIKMLYPLLGTVACDEEGYFYIVWGKEDRDAETGTATMAISKYKKDGTIVKTYKHVTDSGFDTKIPFRSANCDVAIRDRVLVCIYGRQMYNGHQSSEAITVDTKTMKNLDTYYNYASHSFDQRVIFDKYGIAWFVDHGDAYPRGFRVATNSDVRKTSFMPFHFYAAESALDNMFVLNQTHANLGGVIETSSGLVLVGSSVKALKKSGYDSQTQNLFIMYADPEKKMLDGVSRSGVCLEDSVTNKSVKWLTSYTAYDVKTPQVVYTDDDRIVILWEKIKRNTWESKWDETYYMILSSNGKVLQKATKIKNAKLNAHEEPIYKDGYIYWACSGSADDYSNKLKLHRLNLKTLTFDNGSLKVKGLKADSKTKSSVTLKWNQVFNADGYRIYKYNSSTKKYVKVTDVKKSVQKYTVKKLSKGKNYTLAVKAYKKINGKTYWSEYTKLNVKTKK